MQLQPTPIRSTIDGRHVGPIMLKPEEVDQYADLELIGIGGFDKVIEAGFGMDTIQQGLTTPSIPTPVQFLQQWLPGNVAIMTAALKIDRILGISTAGNWYDEEIVQGIQENTGSAVPYGDLTNVPLSNWNLNFETRTVVRFEMGMRVGRLEEMRSAAVRMNSAQTKRASCALALNVQRNAIGFYGYNAGNNKTYGFLNDPGLPAYLQVAAGASGSTLWSRKTFLEITADIRAAVVQLRTQSKDTIDPESVPLTLGLPTDSVDFLTTVTDFGISVRDWMTKTYPKMRVESAPQLNNASAGANVFYLFADSIVDDVSTDDMRTWLQVVPAKFQVLGVAQQVKGYEEDYSNATAGVLLKRPFAVVRYFGI